MNSNRPANICNSAREVSTFRYIGNLEAWMRSHPYSRWTMPNSEQQRFRQSCLNDGSCETFGIDGPWIFTRSIFSMLSRTSRPMLTDGCRRSNRCIYESRRLGRGQGQKPYSYHHRAFHRKRMLPRRRNAVTSRSPRAGGDKHHLRTSDDRVEVPDPIRAIQRQTRPQTMHARVLAAHRFHVWLKLYGARKETQPLRLTAGSVRGFAAQTSAA